MKPSLQLRLSQHLALTPQLQQSIRLLQLSTLELNQEIDQAMADNPLLERDDDPLGGSLRLRNDGAIESAGANPVTPEVNGTEQEAVSATDPGGASDAALDWGHRDARTDDDESTAVDWASTRSPYWRSSASCAS